MKQKLTSFFSQKWKQRDVQAEAAQFQDTEDPEYDDFRTEAVLHKRRQIESFNKAAEAFRQRRRDVASFYAQQVREMSSKYTLCIFSYYVFIQFFAHFYLYVLLCRAANMERRCVKRTTSQPCRYLSE